jgi:AcrR family transcriptional regulator
MEVTPTGSTGSTGLRERKKRQTREEIAATATAMFAERGFEQVTIAEVAAAVGVAKMTVTNHFPLKEDLVFDRAEHIVRGLPDAIAERPEGESVLAAARRYHASSLAAGDPTLGHLGVKFAQMTDALDDEREMPGVQRGSVLGVVDRLDLERALTSADARPSAALQAEWKSFHEHLHGHHHVEDTAMFPNMRKMHPDLAACIDGLSADHRRLDPLLERGDAAFAQLPDSAAALAVVRELQALLAPHLATEEASLIPAFFEKFGDRLPKALWDQHKQLVSRLG